MRFDLLGNCDLGYASLGWLRVARGLYIVVMTQAFGAGFVSLHNEQQLSWKV